MSDIRQKAKELGIKSYHNKKIERLEREIAEIEGGSVEVERPIFEPKPKDIAKLEVKIDKTSYDLMKALGIKDEWIASIANRYGFTKLEYMDKFKAFRCYIDGRCVDWFSLNDLSISNGGGNVVEIINPNRPVDKKKRIINFPWRK